MFHRTRIKAYISLFLSVTLVILYFFMIYKSGCVGDIKTGVFGDPNRSLEIQNSAMYLFYLAMFFAVIATFISYKLKSLLRFVCIFWLLFLLPVIILGSAFFEFIGLNSCLLMD